MRPQIKQHTPKPKPLRGVRGDPAIVPESRTVTEEATLRRLSPPMIRKLIRVGLELPAGSGNMVRLPAFKVGAAVRIPIAEADAYWAIVRASSNGSAA